MLDLQIIWNVVDHPALLLVLGVTAALARPLGRLLGRGTLGVVFVVILGAVLAATTTTGSPHYSLGGIAVYLGQFAHPAHLFQGFAGNPLTAAAPARCSGQGVGSVPGGQAYAWPSARTSATTRDVTNLPSAPPGQPNPDAEAGPEADERRLRSRPV